MEPKVKGGRWVVDCFVLFVHLAAFLSSWVVEVVIAAAAFSSHFLQQGWRKEGAKQPSLSV